MTFYKIKKPKPTPKSPYSRLIGDFLENTTVTKYENIKDILKGKVNNNLYLITDDNEIIPIGKSQNLNPKYEGNTLLKGTNIISNSKEELCNFLKTEIKNIITVLDERIEDTKKLVNEGNQYAVYTLKDYLYAKQTYLKQYRTMIKHIHKS